MVEQIVDRRRGPDRRVQSLSFRFPERRRGFGRRRLQGNAARVAYERLVAAYRDRPVVLALVLVTVAMLNVADLALTLRAVELGAVELNPIMAALLGKDLVFAAMFKVTIGLGVVAVMWAMRRYRRVLEASLLLLGGFTLVTSYSLTMLLVSG